MLILNTQTHMMDWCNLKYTFPNVCAEFEGTKIIRHLDNPNSCDELIVTVNGYNSNISYTFNVSVATIIDLQGILDVCLNNRLSISHFMAHGLSEYLMNNYRNCLCTPSCIEYKHKRLGWYTHRGNELFLYDKTAIGRQQSTCNRQNFKFRHGDEKTYKQFLKDTVYPVSTLALAMAIGYSAPVVSRLKDEFDTGAAIIVNLCGASSTGKTTVEQLMVSPFAYPKISNKDGLVRTFHATNNAIFAGIDDIHGLPIVLDDVTTNPYIDLPNLIYTLASGEEKGRCDTSGELRHDHNGWSGVIVISSETPIQEQSSQNQGLKVRVLQTQGITWTPDAPTAELIKRTVQKHYGFTGIEFAEFVQSIPMDKLCERFEAAQAKVHTLMPKRDGLSDRLETKYTAIYLTIELMNECFKLTLDPNTLTQIILAPEQESVEERDISLKALDCIREFFMQNRDHFCICYDKTITNATDTLSKGERYGIVHHLDGACNMFVLPHIVRKVLEDNKINEIATVKRKWRNSGIIRCEKKRLDIKKLGTRYIHFVFEEGMIDTSIEDFIPKRLTEIPKPTPVFTPDEDWEIPDEDILGVLG